MKQKCSLLSAKKPWFTRIGYFWIQCSLAFVSFLDTDGLIHPNGPNSTSLAEITRTDCEQPGWFPESFGLKDHSIFFADGFTYIMSNYLPHEDAFAYARSADWCNWEDLGPILTDRTPGAPDEQSIWAPYVLEEAGTYYAFYTGVTAKFTQRIMLASTQTPADPDSWQEHGVIFQPNHPDADWMPGEWADCRDPMVFPAQDQYFLYYTGRDTGIDGDYGIVGLATAASPEGPWIDHGATLETSDSDTFQMLESPSILEFQEHYYLFYNNTSEGEEYRVGDNLDGPWNGPFQFWPGWAHELWMDENGQTYTSYLTNYSITISPVTWSYYSVPPRPFIGSQIIYSFIPILQNFP